MYDECKSNLFDSMQRPFKVEHGRQIPVQSPEIFEPSLYGIQDQSCLTVYCRAKPGIIKKYLEPTPFEWVSDDFMVYICDMRKALFEQDGFMDMGIVVPVKFEGICGGHVLFEYESTDHGICAGRELWGYPKKYASAAISETDDKIIASAYKHGVEIIHLELMKHDAPQAATPAVSFRPHLQLHTIPAADGPYIYSQRVIMRNASDYVGKRNIVGAGAATLRGVARNPLDEFEPDYIYGADYSVGDFYSTNENGWGKVLKHIVEPKL